MKRITFAVAYIAVIIALTLVPANISNEQETAMLATIPR